MSNPTPLHPYSPTPVIGITGGIGSGKSTIARELSLRGYRLYDTDGEAKRLIVEDPILRASISSLLGPDVYEGNIYRTDLVAERVFANPDLLHQLESLVHPAVRKDIEKTLLLYPSTPLLLESALLFESGLDALCDMTICVTAPQAVRIERTMARDHVTEEQVRARMAVQMSEQERADRADRVLVNDGSSSICSLVDSVMLTLFPK